MEMKSVRDSNAFSPKKGGLQIGKYITGSKDEKGIVAV